MDQSPAGREPLPSAALTARLLLTAGEDYFIWAAGSRLHFFSVPAEDPSTFFLVQATSDLGWKTAGIVHGFAMALCSTQGAWEK